MGKLSDKARVAVERASKARDDLHGKLLATEAQANEQRETMGTAVLEGGDIEALAAGVAHLEREAEALRLAVSQAASLAESTERAYKDAAQAEALAEIDDLERQIVKVLREAAKLADPLAKYAEAVEALREQAAAAWEAAPYKRVGERHAMTNRMGVMRSYYRGLFNMAVNLRHLCDGR